MTRGERGWLWRAVDDAGEVLDILVQRHRSARAAKRVSYRSVKSARTPPFVVVMRIQRLPPDGANNLTTRSDTVFGLMLSPTYDAGGSGGVSRNGWSRRSRPSRAWRWRQTSKLLAIA
jgi:hypothetical protein